MRKGLTLIELILSMVIIGIVFTVIPRLIMSMNQSAQVTIKEEAMFNALAQMGAIINLPWDQNNTENDQILASDSTVYECNTTSGYRIGGFVGSRNCRPTDDDINLTASSIGMELIAGNPVYNDIDDYTTQINVDNNCSRSNSKFLYSIQPIVIYSNDPSTSSSIQLPGNDNNASAGQTTNTKRIIVKVGYHGDNKHSGCITALEYHSFNIGNIHINSRDW